MDTKLVSVIIASYNHEKYIQDTIKSIIAQTYQNIELIIIDDGSKDTTFEKILELKEECEKRFARVDFEKQENIGCALTISKLIKKAKGDYVYMIASDDLAKPDAIELEADFLNKNPEYGLVVGDDEIIDSEGNRCYWDEKRNNVYDYEKAVHKTFVDFLNKGKPYFYNEKFGTYSTLYIGNYIPNGYLIRRCLFDIITPYTEKAPLEDYFLMLQLSKYCKFKFINKILFSYRWHDTNAVKSSGKKMEKYTQMTREYEEEILNNIDPQKVFPEVIEVKENGVLYKRQGLPYIVEVQKYRKLAHKIKILKIFNIKVFKWIKRSSYDSRLGD